jgi:lysozyme family protein
MSFEQALAFTLKEEGGYVDNPDDRGGATNFGITQHTYDTFRKNRMLPDRSVKDIEAAEIQDIYGAMYWKPAQCSKLPWKLGICHFDWCVNHGIQGATKTLQTAVGAYADGYIGPQTIAAAAAVDEPTAIKKYLELRMDWYMMRADADESQRQFLHGWLARCDRLNTYLEGIT